VIGIPFKTSSQKALKREIAQLLPESISATLSNLINLEKKGIPSPLLNQLKRLAAFQNPEFYKRQRMRLSTALIPRVICCTEDYPKHLALPRGCLDKIQDLLNENGIKFNLKDKRNTGEIIDVSFRGNLKTVQQMAVESLLEDDMGILVAPSGIGKTIAGVYMISARSVNTLVLVHRKLILKQWIDHLKTFLEIGHGKIGQIGGGKQNRTGFIDVAMLQSLVRKGEVKDIVGDYGYVIADECHHVPAFSFEQVFRKAKARFVTGLTATPYRRDGHQPIITMQCGPIRYVIKSKNQLAEQVVDHRLIYRKTKFRMPPGHNDTNIHDVYSALILDEERNQLIFEDVLSVLEEGRSPIVLTERKDHLEILAQKLSRFTRNLLILQGGMKIKKRREVIERLASIPESKERILLATGRYIGEGFDDPRLDTLFLTMPVSWKGTLVQYAGRLNRIYSGKKEVRIYDYVDQYVPMLMRMYEKRLKIYRTMDYRLVT